VILFLKKIIKNEKVDDKLTKIINDQIKETAGAKYAGQRPDSYVPQVVISQHNDLKTMDSEPTDEYKRLYAILSATSSLMDNQNNSNGVLKAAHVEDQKSLSSLSENLRKLIQNGATLTGQYLSAKNIDLSKESNSRNDNQIISQFKYNVQYKYIRPILTTTNTELQDYINAITPAVADEWIKHFEQIYNKYVLKIKNVKIDIGQQFITLALHKMELLFRIHVKKIKGSQKLLD
jgi:hypothetical protein